MDARFRLEVFAPWINEECHFWRLREYWKTEKIAIWKKRWIKNIDFVIGIGANAIYWQYQNVEGNWDVGNLENVEILRIFKYWKSWEMKASSFWSILTFVRLQENFCFFSALAFLSTQSGGWQLPSYSDSFWRQSKLSEKAARWRCEDTFPDSAFMRFLTYMILFRMVSGNSKHTYAIRYHKIWLKNAIKCSF